MVVEEEVAPEAVGVVQEPEVAAAEHTNLTNAELVVEYRSRGGTGPIVLRPILR